MNRYQKIKYSKFNIKIMNSISIYKLKFHFWKSDFIEKKRKKYFGDINILNENLIKNLFITRNDVIKETRSLSPFYLIINGKYASEINRIITESNKKYEEAYSKISFIDKWIFQIKKPSEITIQKLLHCQVILNEKNIHENNAKFIILGSSFKMFEKKLDNSLSEVQIKLCDKTTENKEIIVNYE